MRRTSEDVRCTVHDGAIWMHLDNTRVNIPPHLLNKSDIFLDVQSSLVDPSITKDFTLAVPKDWLRAWAACCCSEDERIRTAEIGDLVNCLLVCFCFRKAAPITHQSLLLPCSQA
jgi:hypothetical protein